MNTLLDIFKDMMCGVAKRGLYRCRLVVFQNKLATGIHILGSTYIYMTKTAYFVVLFVVYSLFYL